MYAGAPVLHCDGVHDPRQLAGLPAREQQGGERPHGAHVHGNANRLWHGLPGDQEFHPQVSSEIGVPPPPPTAPETGGLKKNVFFVCNLNFEVNGSCWFLFVC